jgi:cardiolipin synthase C
MHPATRANPGITRLKLFLMSVALLLSSCADLHQEPSRSLPSYAQPPRPDGGFATLESTIRRAHDDETSGFLLLDRNEDGLRWRLALLDQARHSLDLQYFLWYGDDSGVLLMKRVVQAADRGVHVRLIVDDLLTIGRDFGTAALDAHPNIEIRLFNPWRHRGLAGRGVEMLERLERLNHRMHNKLLVADNQAVILGGRNIGDEYFGLDEAFNFHDLDVLGVGPVARQASRMFDMFWNSEWVSPISALHAAGALDDLKATYAPVRRQLQASARLRHVAIEPQDWQAEIEALGKHLCLGTSRVLTDAPDLEAVSHHMPPAIRALMATSHTELLVVNAYLIPDPKAFDSLRSLTQRGVRVRVLTNSLASHDVPAVNSHYKPWRQPLIEAGIELYEIRPDAAIRRQVADTPPTVSKFMGLHIKAMGVDRQWVFIGSMNLDPRSMQLNSEMGAIIDSPCLAEALARLMERDMAPDNSWQVQLDPQGELRWVSGNQVLSTQPARSLWQRVEDLIFMLFPRDLY